ncbi:hypothetical protein [Aeromicrobium sp. JJY06]|uniref:hypothetical protein n=1 Tax=Aeromicrobium sp. JJY06 TaxID=3373478 RepID=UPI00376F141E
MSASLAERVIRRVGESPVAEAIGNAQQRVYGPLLDWARRSPLHTDAFGHSVHPPLTDVTLGCWLSATILDVVGGESARRSATVLTAAGLAASVPTALAGAGDWTELAGPERRIGAAHSAATDVATFLFLGSLVARLRGNDGAGARFALAGNLVAAGAGFLGGHLALSRGTADRGA